MKKFQTAVIGCGRIGCGFDDNNSEKKILTHAGAYHKNRNVILKAFCDIDESKLKKYGKKYNINNLFKSSNKMFVNSKLDLVSICTLTNSHLKLIKEISETNVKGIFLEKPISDNLADAKKIIEICKSKNIQLIIDHQRRFDPFFHQIKKILQDGKIGNPQLVNIFYGAGIANTGTHVFDLLRYLFGEVKNVKGNFSKNKSTNSRDPNIDVEIEFMSKIVAKMNAVDVNNYGILEMDILCTKGRIKINLTNNEAVFYKISKKGLVYKQLEKFDMKFKRSKYSSIMLGLENLIECVKKNQKPLCSGKDGLKALELIIASIISAKNKKRISLPLKNNKFKIKSR